MSEMNESEGALGILEDEEGIREGLKAVADEKGTITWQQYQRGRREDQNRGERI